MNISIRQGMAVAAGMMVAWSFVHAEEPVAVMAPAQNDVTITDNLFFDAQGGFEKPTGESSTLNGSIGLNWGIPLNRATDGAAYGFQVGGDIKFRDDGPEYDATTGFFIRNLKWRNGQQAELALLLDYRFTSFENHLLALRPVIGTTLTERDGIGLTGVAGISTDAHREGNFVYRQEAIDRIEAFWNRAWTDTISTELSVGYQMSHVDEGLFGAQVVYGLDENWDMAIGGEINTEGNYAVGITATFHFGGTGRHATLHNIGGSGAGLYTPFPKRSFPAMVQRTERKPVSTGGGKGSSGGSSGGPTTGGGSTGGGTDGGTGGGGGGTDGGIDGGSGGGTDGGTGGGTDGGTGGGTDGGTGGGTDGGTGGGTDDGELVTLCHIPPGNPSGARTLRVPLAHVQGHLGHGDKLGACE
jgi:hypothetical protein